MNNDIILGIDLGYSKMGVVSVYKGRKEFGIGMNVCLQVNNPKLKKEDKQRAFLTEHSITLERVIKNSKFVCIEKPFNMPGHGKVLVELLGVLKYMLFKHNVQFIEVPQTTLKKFATGSGKAEKSEMVMKAYKEYGFEFDTEDEVDAFWCAMICHCIKTPEAFSTARRDAVKKIVVIRQERKRRK